VAAILAVLSLGVATPALAAGPPTVVTQPASNIGDTFATLNATVNPNGSEVSECKFEGAVGFFVPCTALPGKGESPVAVTGELRPGQLAPNTKYHFKIEATNGFGTSTGEEVTFTTLPPAATVVTKPASSITQTSAILHGSVNPNGSLVSECKVEWGTTTSYGSSVPCTPAPGSGTSPVEVSGEGMGLIPNTTYHFRVSATNGNGLRQGADETLKTQPRVPIVHTVAASSISPTVATLNARVNPEGHEVSGCTFEWGTTTSYGSTAPCSSPPGSGTTAVAVSAPLTGLSNKSTYHFRISATTSEGQSKGSDRTFTAASPHVYKNGVIAAEGKPIRTITWGNLKLTNTTLGEVECHNVMAGYLENPTGGATAVGKVQAAVSYECVSESCKALGGTAIEGSTEQLPWSAEAIETETGGFRIQNGPQTQAGGAVILRLNCVGKVNAQFVGSGAPLVLNNGTTLGIKPGEQEFDQPGSGELENEPFGGLKLAGKLKTQGYAAQELIGVQNP
jgi:hypothetical protein